MSLERQRFLPDICFFIFLMNDGQTSNQYVSSNQAEVSVADKPGAPDLNLENHVGCSKDGEDQSVSQQFSMGQGIWIVRFCFSVAFRFD